MIILMKIAGFLFLLILAVYMILIPAFGYQSEIGDSDTDTTLQKINNNPKKFQVGIGIALMHNVCVILLTILLFIVYSPYNIILGIVLLIFRTGEGLMLIYNDKKYGELLEIARKYSSANDAEKRSLSDLTRTLTKIKGDRFVFAMLLWGIGTLAFSILLVTYNMLPLYIGWLGIVAGISQALGNGIKLKKPNLKVIGGILAVLSITAILFEILLGIWLLFYT